MPTQQKTLKAMWTVTSPNREIRMKERVVYLKDLLGSLAKKWPIAVCFVLAGALALNFYAYFKAVRASEEASQDASVKKLAELKAELSETEAEYVEVCATNYEWLSKQYALLSQELPEEEKRDPETVAQLLNVSEAMEKCSAGMTSAQKSYFTALTGKTESGQGSGQNASLIQPKWALIGALLGLVLFVLVFGFLYVADDRIKTEEEVKECFELPVLAAVRLGEIKGNKKQGLTKEEGLVQIKDRLLFSGEGEKPRSLCLVYEGNDQAEQEYAEEIRKSLEKEDLSVSPVQDAGNDPSLNRKASETDGVVILRHLKASKGKNLQKDLDSIRTSGKKVLGAVLLKD